MRIGFLGAGRVVSYQIERFKKYDDLEVVGFYLITHFKINALLIITKSLQNIRNLLKSKKKLFMFSIG